MENRFKVVYTGQLQPYVSAQEAVHNIAALLKVTEDRVRALVLGGRARDIKTDIDEGTAKRYASALSKAGLLVRVEPMDIARPDLRLAPLNAAEEAAQGREGLAKCPKCGAFEVHNDICGACGLVISKYVAHREEVDGDAPRSGTTHGMGPGAGPSAHPQAPPGAVPTPGPSARAEIRTGPHAVPIGHGWDWIGRGFWHFKANPWAWILLTVCYLVIAMALSLIPIVGALAAYLVMPIFTAGLMLGARAQDQRESLRFGHLFAGFSSQPGQLLAAGALYLLGIGLATIPAVLLLGAPLFLDMAGMDPGQLGQEPRLMAERMEDILTFPTLLLAALVVTLLALPVVMAYWFSPALIAIDGMRAWPAMKLSFKGCLRNILPFLLYGVAGLFLVILGSLPMFLGLLVVLPVLTASIYAAYRDIFYNRSGVG